MEVSRSGYLDTLRSRISDDERRELENGGGILISRYNRETVLRMLRDNVSLTGAVDIECAEELERTLKAYLGQYMADQPEGHKWCLCERASEIKFDEITDTLER